MAVPDFLSIMLPLLNLLANGQSRTARECSDALAQQFGLSTEERKELLPSGRQSVFDNRVGWSRTYLVKAELLERTGSRGAVRITERGRETLGRTSSRLSCTNCPTFCLVLPTRQLTPAVDFAAVSIRSRALSRFSSELA